MHDYFTFSDTKLPDYGKAKNLDRFEKWFGVQHIIGGHIHNPEIFDGVIIKEVDGQPVGFRTMVDYLGSLSRPQYREGHTKEVGYLLLITVYDNGEYKYDRMEIKLPSLAETFNLSMKEKERQLKESKEGRVDISDIVHNLDEHERSIGNPEDIILSLEGVDERYKLKAIELLKEGLA